MTQPLPWPNFDHLTASEKLELIGQLWDSIPESLDDLPVPEWHREIIKERLEDADSHPERFASWEEVRRRLLGES